MLTTSFFRDGWAWFLAGILWAWFVIPSHASPHMRIEPCDGISDYHKCAWVTIAGQVMPGDRDEFLTRTNDIQKATVILSGPGGALRAAINIGEIIHARDFATYVPPGGECDSACAYIWVSGKTRGMGLKSVLAWHSAYFGKDDQHADGNGNALLGMYLSHMGFTYDDVDRMVGNDPNDMHATVMDEDGIQRRVNLRCDDKGCKAKQPARPSTPNADEATP